MDLYNFLKEDLVLDIEDHVAVDAELLVELPDHVGEWNLLRLRNLFPYINSHLTLLPEEIDSALLLECQRELQQLCLERYAIIVFHKIIVI